MGDVIRLFAADTAALAVAERILGIEVLVQRRVVLAMAAKPVPTGCKSAAFCRVRPADSLGRRTRGVAPAVRERMKDAVRARAHELAFIRMSDREGQHARPLFFSNVTSDAVTTQLATNSYGLSSSQAPCFLPDF